MSCINNKKSNLYQKRWLKMQTLQQLSKIIRFSGYEKEDSLVEIGTKAQLEESHLQTLDD